VLVDRNEYERVVEVKRHLQDFAGDFLNLDNRDENADTLTSSSSEESTDTRGFFVRPGKI
jgi:hypothetical protein